MGRAKRLLNDFLPLHVYICRLKNDQLIPEVTVNLMGVVRLLGKSLWNRMIIITYKELEAKPYLLVRRPHTMPLVKPALALEVSSPGGDERGSKSVHSEQREKK